MRFLAGLLENKKTVDSILVIPINLNVSICIMSFKIPIAHCCGGKGPTLNIEKLYSGEFYVILIFSEIFCDSFWVTLAILLTNNHMLDESTRICLTSYTLHFKEITCAFFQRKWWMIEHF
jgi:hypothetical protein